MRQLLPSVEDLIDPVTLSLLEPAAIRSVHCERVEMTSSNTGNRFYEVTTNEGSGPRYLLKRRYKGSNVIVSGPDGDFTRTVILWQHGVFDRLPKRITHPVLACAHDGTGYAVLMRDVSDILLSGDRRYTLKEHTFLLETLAALHAAFWEDEQIRQLNLHTLSGYFLIEPDYYAWNFVEDFLEPDVAQIVRSLLENPKPLYDALSSYPSTLIHNDVWYGNLGITRDTPQRVLLLDWDYATFAPPGVELALYIDQGFLVLPTHDEATIAETYRRYLAQRLGDPIDERAWQRQLELCSLGEFMRRSKWVLESASRAPDSGQRQQLRERLSGWSRVVRRGAELL
jgi:hypothetical protein